MFLKPSDYEKDTGVTIQKRLAVISLLLQGTVCKQVQMGRIEWKPKQKYC